MDGRGLKAPWAKVRHFISRSLNQITHSQRIRKDQHSRPILLVDDNHTDLDLI